MSESKLSEILEETASFLENLAKQEAENANDSYCFGYANGLRMAARFLKEVVNDRK